MLLEDRVVIVTGAATPRGIGRATARRLAEEGARVAVLDRDGNGASAVAGDLRGDHLGLECNVTDSTSVTTSVAQVREQLGVPSILVAVAGVTQPKSLSEITGSDYDFVLDANLRGSLLCAQAVVPWMQEAGGGSLVFMSSVSAKRGGGVFGGPHYSAAKAGICGLTRALARDLAPHGIRANAVAPGFIDTDITAGKLSQSQKEEVIASIPLGRPGTATDVANTIVFLASDLSAYMTGEVLDVNGGSHIG